ncbi:hypothetical protein ACJMK2_004899 [Sinanodonta woodiana]|uniref:Uncharacterized protein n=1 Tax=Sinanodonta woodiana TaxID=1069815 RepID=A0ABD3VNP3_SINWO
MYASHAFSTPFSVKDILGINWSDQAGVSSHYGLDYSNPNYANFPFDNQRMGDQMSPLMNSINNSSCLYSSNSTMSSMQPTYTNLSCSSSVSSMHLPVIHTDSMSPKQEYDTSGVPTPGSVSEESPPLPSGAIDTGPMSQPVGNEQNEDIIETLGIKNDFIFYFNSFSTGQTLLLNSTGSIELPVKMRFHQMVKLNIPFEDQIKIIVFFVCRIRSVTNS